MARLEFDRSWRPADDILIREVIIVALVAPATATVTSLQVRAAIGVRLSSLRLYHLVGRRGAFDIVSRLLVVGPALAVDLIDVAAELVHVLAVAKLLFG